MSVSFVEPDIENLRKQLLKNANSNHIDSSAVHDDDNHNDHDAPKKSAMVVRSLIDGSVSKSGNAHNQKHHTPIKTVKRSTLETTLSNTASNSLSFKRLHDDIPEEPRRPRSNSRRRISAANSRSSSMVRSLSKDRSRSQDGKPKSSLRRRSSDDTYAQAQDDAGIGKFSEDEDDLLEDTPFLKRVSFDTINIDYHNPPVYHIGLFSRPSFSGLSVNSFSGDKEDTEFNSFSVSSKHEDYAPSYGSRTILCALSSVSTSMKAVVWLINHVLADGDELLCLKVEKDDSKPVNYYQDKAENLLTSVVQAVADTGIDLKINIIVELCVGGVKHIVRQSMVLYQPALVIVGTSIKQYHNVMRYMTKKNTLSNYLINHSPVPVIVVVQEMLDKREALNIQEYSTLGDLIKLEAAKKAKCAENDSNKDNPGKKSNKIKKGGDDSNKEAVVLTTPSITVTSDDSVDEIKIQDEDENDGEITLDDALDSIVVGTTKDCDEKKEENRAFGNKQKNYIGYLLDRQRFEDEFEEVDKPQYKSLFEALEEEEKKNKTVTDSNSPSILSPKITGGSDNDTNENKTIDTFKEFNLNASSNKKVDNEDVDPLSSGSPGGPLSPVTPSMSGGAGSLSPLAVTKTLSSAISSTVSNGGLSVNSDDRDSSSSTGKDKSKKSKKKSFLGSFMRRKSSAS